MPIETICIAGSNVCLDLDQSPPLAQLPWGVVRVHLIDENTDRAPCTTPLAETAAPGFTARAAADGIGGLIAVPARVFPSLASQGYTVIATFGAEGFLSVTETIAIAMQPGFPGSFQPVNYGPIELHREPIVLKGRTVSASGGVVTPVVGATVAVSGFWATAPPAHTTIAPQPPNMIWIASPLYAARDTAGGTVAQRNFTTVPGEDKAMLASSAAGATVLALSDQLGIAVGSFIVIDVGDPGRTEYATVQSVKGASTPDQPAAVTIDLPLTRLHPQGCTVSVGALGAAGAANPLSRAAIPGDVCLFLGSMNDLATTTNLVEIAGAGSPNEYHAIALYEATSDAYGYYRLPPLSRMAQLTLHATGGAAPVDITVSPDYAVCVNRVDIVFD